ncbi:hypothetical protein B0H19DRAFT_1271039 [Mycena capillaripes]|nr:hypothetical protein B0H19DRAFT_1271039 [Mycena capillaripes]
MSSLNTRFDAADDLTVLEITDYRSFFFPPSVCEPNGEVYFSLDDAPEWMTACGYRLWQEHDPTKRLDRSFHPDNALLKELRGYRNQFTFNDELSKSNVLPNVIIRLKSILGLDSQEEIDAWHAFCAGQTHPKVQQWYLQKQRNPWYLPSVNAHLSKVSRDDWNITPRTTNIAETSHASTNADTSTSLPLLPAILATQERDRDDIDEIHQIARDGIRRKRWNGPSERERLAEQRAGWSARKRDERNDDLATYDALAQDRDEGQEEWRFSLARGHALQEQIQLVQAELKLDKRRTDLSEEIKTLRAAVEFEKQARRNWVVRRGQIDVEMKVLRAGPLKGVQINRTRMITDQTDSIVPELGSPLQVPDMNDPNDEPEQEVDEDMTQLDYFPSNPNDPIFDDLMPVDTALPPQVTTEHPAEPPFHWSTSFVLDPALEPNYHRGSDDPVASSAPNYSASGSDYVLSLPPLPPPPADQPTETSGPSRARRRKPLEPVFSYSITMSAQDLQSLMPLREIYLQLALLSLFMHGTQSTSCHPTLYGTVTRNRGQWNTSRVFVYIPILAMYIVSTGCAATLWLVAKRTFITHGQSPEDTVAYLISSPMVDVITAALPVNIFIADTILADLAVLECVEPQDQDSNFAGSLCAGRSKYVLGAIVIATEIQEGLVTAVSGKRGADLALSYFTLALVSQLSATLLIIYRVFSLKLGQTHRYARVIEMLVESAAPNCIILICFLPFYAILVQTAGIGPTLIVARVTFGMARPEDEWECDRKSGIRRAGGLPVPNHMSRSSPTITSPGSII